MAYAQASLIEKTLEPMDARKQKETLVESRPLATPESRFECARTAITEALGLCATADGKPNMAALAAAEDRYNTALAEDMMAAVVAYVGRVDDTDNTDSTDDNSDSGVEGEMRMSIGPEFFEIFEASCQTWREGRTRLGTHEDAVAAFVSRARNPCATLGPFSQCGYHCPRVLADPIYTGRPQNVETAMWRTWWATCIEMLTSTTGPNGPPGSVHPLDAPFCATALALAKALLDVGTERADEYRSTISQNAEGARWSPEDGLSDHAARHWAQMPHDAQGPYNISRWHVMRAVLVGFIGLMERVYNTHAVYDTLGVAAFEADIVRHSVPSHLFS